jgi:hypothetical protein
MIFQRSGASKFSTSTNTLTLDEYLDEPEKFSRTRNLLEVQEQSLYYFPAFGVDKGIIREDRGLQIEAIQSYIRQKAFNNGIVLLNAGKRQDEFVYNLDFYVEV